MMYIAHPEIKDLYILHRYSVGGSQGDESFLEEIIATGNDKKELEAIGERKYPLGSSSGWRWDEYRIVVNTATEEGDRLWQEQKAYNKHAWEQIDEHPENYEGATIIGNRSDEDSCPIALWMQPNPALDSKPEEKMINGYPLSSYTYIVYDVSDNSVDKPEVKE